jgi:uncharacterized GH25 family protein
MKKNWILTSALLCAVGTAQAHQIWLEESAQGSAVVRFGEFGDNLREASPGLLDKFGKPVATLVSAKGDKSAGGRKEADGFVLPFKAQKGESIVVEDAQYPLYTWGEGDKQTRSWFYPAARQITDFSAQKPRLPLDLVPTGTPGELQLTYKDKPLPRTKVTLTVQSGWMKQAQTDEQGRVTFDMPWAGTYVAEASHEDKTGGERKGPDGAGKYDIVYYVTTLTYDKPDGIEPVPAGPAASPNQ